jgi:GTP-binding protein
MTQRPGSLRSSPLARARFEFGAAELSQLPPDDGREVAFAGRSNAGKSSALNALTGRRKLAFVSKTPGRTQQINYYSVEDGRYLVDLPGYGYAKVPGELQQRWQRVMSAYLLQRRALLGLVLMMDVRHPLTPLDRQMLEWFAPTGKPVLVLLTKSDKLTRQEQGRQLALVRSALAREPGQASVLLFSSVSRLGVDEGREFVERVLGLAGPDTASPAALSGAGTGGEEPAAGAAGAHRPREPGDEGEGRIAAGQRQRKAPG